MKKVAIVTPEALSPNSFLWGEDERFKVKINDLVENPISQEEDGLYIFGDGNEVVVESTNELGRYIFTDGVVELPHLSLEITSSNISPLLVIPKVNIPEAVFHRLNDGEISTTYMYRMESGQRIPLEMETSCRIAYRYSEYIVVMDVFLARVEGPIQFGFVDVLIQAKTADFPSTRDDIFHPEPPQIAT